MKYILQTDNLTKKYNGVKVIDNVNMHIEEGDIYGFVGENGAGKTTIIRLICGLTMPTSGTFNLFGVINTDKQIYTVKKQMSGIVENVSINKNLDAIENLRLQCYLTEIKYSDEELIAILREVGLEYAEIKSKKVGKFSLGMRQRLGIAIAMLSNPKFIILDEPMNGLDPKGFIDVREIILKLNKQGVTFLISSHILSELDKICNKIGIISHGRLLEELTMEELHNNSRKHIYIEFLNEEDKNRLFAELNVQDIKKVQDGYAIYDDIDINTIIKALSINNISIKNITLNEDTIEDYYMKVVRRG